MRTILSFIICVAITNVNFAQEKKAETKCPGQCPIEAAMTALPKIQYKVAGKSIDGCIQCAKTASKESGKPVVYVVAKKDFAGEAKAKVALVEVTEKFVKDFATPCKCEVSKITTIAGKKCDCPVDAASRAKLVSTAMSKVAMSFKVGEKTCSCPREAKTLETKSGKAKEFVVNGVCTPCEMTARLNLAHAKYKAAVEALAKAETATTKTKTKG